MATRTNTYRHTTIGFEADIKRMPEQYEYSLSFFDRFYRPDNAVLMVIGDFTSLHVAAQHGVDPGPVPVIDEIAAALARPA